jgi:Dolichyl-phosphate-mannose-protein mannosyltransferase
MPVEETVREDNLSSLLGRTLRLSKRATYSLTAFLVLYAIVRSLVGAAHKPFGFDEILTQIVSMQPSVRGIWDALRRAVDGQGPLFYLLERAASKLSSNREVALRLPGTLAFACTLVCIFVYVRKRNGEVIAFLCMSILLLTTGFHTYAVDARAYSLVLACIAFALVCYQRVSSIRWTVLLAITLALAESLHYYTVFAMAPFVVAEAFVLFRTHDFRWRVWVALAFGALPLAVFWPLLAGMKAYYGPHLWKNYRLSSIPENYGSFFFVGSAFGVSVIVLSMAGVISALLRQRFKSESVEQQDGMQPTEGILILTLMASPLIIFIATSILGGSMVERYTLSAIIGISLAIGWALSLARRSVLLLFSLFLFSSVGLHEFSFWSSTWRHPFRLDSPARGAEFFVNDAGHHEILVAVSDGLAYLPLAYYASPSFADRFVYLVDPDKAAAYLGYDSVDRGLLAVRDFAPFQVKDYSKFIASHPVFFILVEEPGAGFDWVMRDLSERASLQLVETKNNRRLYLVDFNKGVSR